MLFAIDFDRRLTEMEELLPQLNLAIDNLIASKEIADKKITVSISSLEVMRDLLKADPNDTKMVLKLIENTLKILR